MLPRPTIIFMSEVTVIITTKTDTDLLDHCLTTLAHQTVKPNKIILALEADEREEDFEVYINHYNLTLTKSANMGVVSARNEALKEVTTEYVVFATPAVTFYEDCIEKLLNTVGDYDFAYCGYGLLNPRIGGFRTVMPAEYDQKLLLKEQYTKNPALIRTEAIDYFDDSVGESYDWDLFLRLGKGKLCPDILFDRLAAEDGNQNTILLERKHEIVQKEPDETIEGVAFLMQNISSYSGGRVHSWMQALSIADLDIPITIYTDKIPPFVHDFPMYKQPRIKVCDLETLDVKADLYWSSPYLGHMKALQLSRKYDKWSIQPFFDPPNWQKQYHDGESYEAAIVNPLEYKRQYELYKHDKIKILSSTYNGVEGYKEFYGFTDNQFVVLPPAINTRVIEVFDQSKLERKNWIVSTNRNVPSKAWDEALGAFIPFMDKYRFVIITNNANTIVEKADKFGIPRSSLIIRDGGIPDSEKFLIFLQSKAMLVASHFEGFGMHLTEAMACGLSYASYELPPLKEIRGTYEKTDTIHFAKYGNVEDLRRKLGDALKVRYWPKKVQESPYSFDTITKQIKDLLQSYL